MKKIFLILACLLQVSLLSRGQPSLCATDDNWPNDAVNFPQSVGGNPGPYLVRVCLIILRDDYGVTDVTQAEIDFALARLAADLEPHNICISLHGTTTVDNSGMYWGQVIGDVWTFGWFGTYACQDAINIVILPHTTNPPGGQASSPAGTMMMVGGDWSFPQPWCYAAPGYSVLSTSIISHEFGHCLGLRHTHRCSGCDYINPSCRESANQVDHPDCSYDGDYVCDTPADPCMSWNNDAACEWCDFGMTDNWGDTYYPDIHNIMSYARGPCLTHFSNGQGQRMRDFILNDNTLVGVTVPEDIAVQNLTFATDEHLYAAWNSITSGYGSDVTIFENDAIGEYHTNNIILLGSGFRATPNSNGSFWAHIDPVFCHVLDENSARHDNPLQSSNPDAEINLYPNPTEGIFTLQLTDTQFSNSVFIVMNALWEKIFERKIVSEKTEIDLSTQPSGVYFVAVITETGNTIVKKLMKM